MPRYFQRLCGLVRKGITQYNMIQDGDKIAIGVSGGKDSVMLTLALAQLRKYMDVKFDIVAVTLDCQFSGKETDYSALEKLFADRGVESPDDVGDPQGRMSFQFSFVHLS